MSPEEKPGDQIRIEQREIFVHIGVPDEERASPQRLITLWPVGAAGHHAASSVFW